MPSEIALVLNVFTTQSVLAVNAGIQIRLSHCSDLDVQLINNGNIIIAVIV